MKDPKHTPVDSIIGARIRQAGLPFHPRNAPIEHTGFFVPHLDVIHGVVAPNDPDYEEPDSYA